MSHEAKEVKVALEALRRSIQWKPGKDLTHLEKRKRRGHLSKEFSLEDLNRLIQNLIHQDTSKIYLYRFGENRYYIVRGEIEKKEWFIIFSKEGIIETVFPPRNAERYLSRRGMALLGEMREIVK